MAATVSVKEKDLMFQNRLRSFSIINEGFTNLNDFFEAALERFFVEISEIVEDRSIIIVSTCFVGEYIKTAINEKGELYDDQQKLYTGTDSTIIDIETDLDTYFNDSVVDVLKKKIEETALRGSGFRLYEIVELNIQVASFEPLAGSSFIELPTHLQAKKAIVNVQNFTDQMCFQYAILSAIHPCTKNAQRPQKYSQYIHAKELNFEGIEFPVQLRDIAKFEKQNTHISIHVYMYNDAERAVHPVRLAKQINSNHIHLLLLTEDSIVEVDSNFYTKTHYCWIKNLSALLSKQTSTNRRKKIFCDRCLNHFSCKEKLNAHIFDCSNQNECSIEMPTEDTNKIRFEKIQNQLMVPFIIYADIESMLIEPDTVFCNTEKTTAFQQHKAYSIGYYVKYLYDDTRSQYKSKRTSSATETDCIDWFVNEMRTIANEISNILSRPKLMLWSANEKKLYAEAKHCHICGGEYDIIEKAVRDHSHITGEYRGSAHAKCNLQFQESRYVPVVFHNLSHYDAHFIIQKIAENGDGSVSAIALNDELYISFTKVFPSNTTTKFTEFIKFRFIDSFRFMPSSLDYLTSLLPTEKKKITHAQLSRFSVEQIKLLERKGVFCYDYIDGWSKLSESQLPAKELFYSKLTESDISDADYKHAQLVWNAFGIRTLGEYSDLYMQTDILLLADVFENFRETCHTIYGLDPAHYITAPSLSFDAMLKYTKIEIELLTDIDMLLFVERGIRGGISQCSKRYEKANNKYMNTAYNPQEESNYLIYLDANNLYGHSMSQYLPWKDFRWCEHKFTAHTIMQIPDESCDGFIFEVDLEYPTHLHNLHSDYPMCPEKRLPFGPSTDNAKLLLTLYDKERYVVHYRMLRIILQQGLQLKKIHRVLQFEQRPWLKPYIDLNTKLRTRATNDFEKNFFKLMVNTIFGKTMENKRGRVDIKLKTEWDGRYGARKLIVQPNFKRWTAFGSKLVAIHMNHTKILMDKPITVGMTVLDLSKVLMYDFFYNFLKPKYGNNIEMMYTDTDSFILNVKTDCFYTDMLADIDERYDTSDFAENNMYSIPRKNKKKPGFFKDELNGKIMTAFVGLRSKMYAFKCDGVETKKAKGVKKYVLRKNVQFSDFVDCIQQESVLVREQNSFRSKKHTVFSVRQAKIALSPFDDKRFVLADNIHTLPWGHSDIFIEEVEEQQ